MFARVSRYRIPQEKLGAVVSAFNEPIDELQALEGNRGGYLLIDRESSMALTVTMWETEAAMRASEMATNRMRSDAIDSLEGDILSVDRCEVAIDTTQQTATA
jgi:heme-degrading monooxygenase HmoA